MVRKILTISLAWLMFAGVSLAQAQQATKASKKGVREHFRLKRDAIDAHAMEMFSDPFF